MNEEKGPETVYEPRRQRRRPGLKHYEIPYDERQRGLERDRERNAHHIVEARRHWDIAKLTLSRLAGENELLRGVHIGEEDRFLWWPARVMAHHEGFRVVERHIDPDIRQKDYTEIEINRTDDNELCLYWTLRKNAEGRFEGHPILAELVDGCLAVRGRPILKQGNGLRLGARSQQHITEQTDIAKEKP